MLSLFECTCFEPKAYQKSGTTSHETSLHRKRAKFDFVLSKSMHTTPADNGTSIGGQGGGRRRHAQNCRDGGTRWRTTQSKAGIEVVVYGSRTVRLQSHGETEEVREEDLPESGLMFTILFVVLQSQERLGCGFLFCPCEIDVQMNERWKIQEEVRRQEKLKEFMERHADRFVGASDRGKLLRHYLEDLRLEEESGRFRLVFLH